MLNILAQAIGIIMARPFLVGAIFGTPRLSMSTVMIESIGLISMRPMVMDGCMQSGQKDNRANTIILNTVAVGADVWMIFQYMLLGVTNLRCNI